MAARFAFRPQNGRSVGGTLSGFTPVSRVDNLLSTYGSRPPGAVSLARVTSMSGTHGPDSRFPHSLVR